jgi:hypothetical protein
LQNIMDLLSGLAPSTQNVCPQEGGGSGNVSNIPARDEFASGETRGPQNILGGSESVHTFAANSYQKLPHPLCQQIKELPIVDGTDMYLVNELSHVTVFMCKGEM